MSDIKKIIKKLNNNRKTVVGSSPLCFYYKTDGEVDFVFFNEIQLWDSETDDREHDSITGELEPLEKYIRRRYNYLSKKMSKLRF